MQNMPFWSHLPYSATTMRCLS